MDLIYLLGILSIGQGVLLLVYLWSSRFSKQVSIRILSVLVMIFTLVLYDDLIINFGADLPIQLFYLGSPLVLVLGPLLFLFAKSIARKAYRLSAIDMLHLLPFVCLSLFILLDFQFKPESYKLAFITHFQAIVTTGKYETNLNQLLINSAARLIVIFYTVLGIRLLFSKSTENIGITRLANFPTKFIRFFYIGTFTLLALSTIGGIFRYCEIPLTFFFDKGLLLIFALHIFGFTFIYIKNPVWKLGVSGKYQKSGLGVDEEIKHKKSLEKVLGEEQLFCNPLLTLPKLSSRIGLSPHQLSQVINNQFDQTYNELVQSYRIEHAKQLLKDKSLEHLAISEIGERCGFIVSSTFYRNFKKIVGQTPAAYRMSKGDD